MLSNFYTYYLTLFYDNIEDQEEFEHGESYAPLLYGLIHSRFIITARGMQLMLEKYLRGNFGVCQRTLCYGQHMLPVGISDVPRYVLFFEGKD